MQAQKTFNVARKPVPFQADAEPRKKMSLSDVLRKPTVPSKTKYEVEREIEARKQKRLSSASWLEAERSLTIGFLEPPDEVPEETHQVPPLSQFRGGLGIRRDLPMDEGDNELFVFPNIDLQTETKITSLASETRPLRRLSSDLSCSLCLDTVMAPHSLELRCGHFVHKACFQDCTNLLEGAIPICSTCGNDCIKVESNSGDQASSFYSSPSLASVVSFGENVSKNHCDVDPLSVHTFVHLTQSDKYELLVRITASKGLSKSQWKHTHSSEERNELRRYTLDALELTKLAKRSMKDPGKLRLVSTFKSEQFDGVKAYLFERFIVLSTITTSGFDDLIALYNLTDDETEIEYDPRNGLILRDNENKITLKSDRPTISTWISAVNDLSLSFRLVADGDRSSEQLVLNAPFNPGFVESCRLDHVLCTPVAYVKQIIPCMLEKLGPQDRLGLIVVTKDGSSAWIKPRKPSWKGWNKIIMFEVETCELFTPASKPLIETAISILGNKVVGRHQSITVVSGCPLVSSVISQPMTVHAIGIGSEYDVKLMLRLVNQSSNGKFYHVDSVKDLAQCCAGLFAADRTYVHHNINLTIKFEKGAVVNEFTPRTIKMHDHIEDHFEGGQHISIPLGSLMAGQSRTILIELKINESFDPGSVIANCNATSISAVTGEEKSVDSMAFIEGGDVPRFVARPVFFDRLALVSSEILFECLSLAKTDNYASLYSLLDRASDKIELTTLAAAKEESNVPQRQYFLELNEPDHTFETQLIKSEYLASGLNQLNVRVEERSRDSKSTAMALLYEAARVLESQCAVTSKTMIERVFFETLDCNCI